MNGNNIQHNPAKQALSNSIELETTVSPVYALLEIMKAAKVW